MNEAQTKDHILNQLKAFKPHGEIKDISKHIDELEKDGYISAVRDQDGDLIIARITPKGKRFIERGGYTADSKKLRYTKIRKALFSPTGRIIEGVVIATLAILVGWWLKERYDISDNPECGEQRFLKNDSTSLSSLSSFLLNADSAAIRGNSRAWSLDSSESTLESADTGISESDTSAVHSSTREESNAMPLGR